MFPSELFFFFLNSLADKEGLKLRASNHTPMFQPTKGLSNWLFVISSTGSGKRQPSHVSLMLRLRWGDDVVSSEKKTGGPIQGL